MIATFLLLSFFFGLLAFIACSGMFSLKYHVVARESYLFSLQKQIQKNQRAIHILNAEWSNLTEPRRIRALVQTNTNLSPIQTMQVINWADVDEKYERAP